jgi:hypothetical protein
MAKSDVRPTPIQRAKDTLLRALDQLDEAETDLGGLPEYVELVVVYSIGLVQGEDGAFHEVGGWSATPGPHWSQAAMLRRAATAFEADNPVIATDDEDEDEE